MTPRTGDGTISDSTRRGRVSASTEAVVRWQCRWHLPGRKLPSLPGPRSFVRSVARRAWVRLLHFAVLQCQGRRGSDRVDHVSVFAHAPRVVDVRRTPLDDGRMLRARAAKVAPQVRAVVQRRLFLRKGVLVVADHAVEVRAQRVPAHARGVRLGRAVGDGHGVVPRHAGHQQSHAAVSAGTGDRDAAVLRGRCVATRVELLVVLVPCQQCADCSLPSPARRWFSVCMRASGRLRAHAARKAHNAPSGSSCHGHASAEAVTGMAFESAALPKHSLMTCLRTRARPVST